MEAEETMTRGAPLPTITLGKDSANPVRIVVFVSMTIRAVIHNLSIMDFLMLVNLPKDNSTRARAPQAVAKHGTKHLGFSQDVIRH